MTTSTFPHIPSCRSSFNLLNEAMPIGTSLALYAVVTLTLPAVLAAGLAIEMTPNAADAWAVVGSMFATVLALLEALKSGRDFRQLFFIAVASAGVGSFLPGVLVYNALAPSTVEHLTWHSWVCLGAMFGAVGSGGMHGAIWWGNRRAASMVEDQFDRWTRERRERTEAEELNPPPFDPRKKKD